MTQQNSDKFVLKIEKSLNLRGKNMNVLDVLDLKKINQDSVRLTILVGNEDSKTEPEVFTFGIDTEKVDLVQEWTAEVLDLSKDQLKAIHAKEAEKKVISAPKEEEPVRKVKPRAISLPPKEEKVTVLPSQAADPVDWKNNEDVKRYKRPHLNDDLIRDLLKDVFRYDPKDRKMTSFSRYIFDQLPEQYGISQDQAERIYLCKSYAHIGRDYKASWTKKLNELCRLKGVGRMIPTKLRKMYLKGGK
jgi:hypothetical protein|tara:strand:- start:342 stop:1079 length:738 start_codon:yes stop_codon:yes gene_type:complete